MGIADSTIVVKILGDAKNLQKTLGGAEKSVGGFGGAVKGALALGGALVVTDKLVEFAGDALNEFDRLGDATSRLKLQLGPLSSSLIDSADSMHKLGLSAQDALELDAAFADIATSAQLSDTNIAGMATTATATAAALSLTDAEGRTAAEMLDLIAKAGAGADKPLKELGISLTDDEVAARAMADTGKDTADALTDGELAAARYQIVLEKLKPRLDDVATGSGDVESKQRELQARWETLTGKIGGALEGPLSDFLDWVLSGISGLERLDEFVALVTKKFQGWLTPIARVADAIRTLVGLIQTLVSLNLGDVLEALGGGGGRPAPRPSRAPRNSPGSGNAPVTVNVQGGDPAQVERAVLDAVRGYTRRNGMLIEDI